jgi:hypothetical protein
MSQIRPPGIELELEPLSISPCWEPTGRHE